MASIAFLMAARLSLHSLGRKPEGDGQNLLQPFPCDVFGRSLARRGVEVRDLGEPAWGVPCGGTARGCGVSEGRCFGKSEREQDPERSDRTLRFFTKTPLHRSTETLLQVAPHLPPGYAAVADIHDAGHGEHRFVFQGGGERALQVLRAADLLAGILRLGGGALPCLGVAAGAPRGSGAEAVAFSD